VEPLLGFAESHPELLAAAMNIRIEPLLPTWTDCDGGGVPPIWNAKLRGAAGTMSVGAALIVRFTGIVCGLLEALAELNTMEPVYVLAARPAGLTEMLTLLGVVPPPELTESQPELLATAIYVTFPPALAISTDWAAGTGPPLWKEKFTGAVGTVSEGAAATVRFTGTVCGLLEAPAEVTLIDPE
jgi:hypothetical protein